VIKVDKGVVLQMTQRDIDRIKTLHFAIQKKITQGKAGEILGLCRRQVNRLCQKAKKKGDRAIIHGLRATDD
jgi:DNA-binding transcriptional regulator LsrR (DeoR family)